MRKEAGHGSGYYVRGTGRQQAEDSRRKIVAGILRPGTTEPELREIPNEPKLVRRLLERLKREGPVEVCDEAGVSGYDLYRRLARRATDRRGAASPRALSGRAGLRHFQWGSRLAGSPAAWPP